jgi:hypothetical protein
MTPESNTRLTISSKSGVSSLAQEAIQPQSVARDSSTPWRAKMSSSRYSGRWSAYLLVIVWANSPGPGSPLSIGWGGLAAIATCSWQVRQA